MPLERNDDRDSAMRAPPPADRDDRSYPMHPSQLPGLYDAKGEPEKPRQHSGRLITPLSAEEWNKLPAWQKWVSLNAFWVVPAVTAAMVGFAAVLHAVFK